jgi:GcrA cell cycle regulator
MPRKTESVWDAEMEERLKTLREQGVSKPKIAAQLGVSMGAVSGKCFRLGLLLPSTIEREWTEADEQQLREFAEKQCSLSTIRRVMRRSSDYIRERAEELGVVLFEGTRNNVIADLHTLQPATKPVFLAPRKTGRPSQIPTRRVIDCCWPIGEPGAPGFRFCGERSAPGRSYCEEHLSLAFRPKDESAFWFIEWTGL